MGALFAPFTKVAAANPHAAAPVERSAAELVTPTEANRPIADPYTRYIVAREKVNQGAAVLLTSVAAARRLGIARGPVGVPARPRGPARTGPDGPRRPVGRPGVGHGRPACPRAWRASARTTWPRSTCTAAFPRRCSTSATGSALTPTIRVASPSPAACRSSAAPGNNYSMHAIAETVQRARSAPGSYGLVGANGGIMSKYSAGVYSTTPAAWTPDRSARPASRDRRLARARAGPLRRRSGHHRDLHRQARARRRPHRHRRRPPGCRRKPLRGQRRRPGPPRPAHGRKRTDRPAGLRPVVRCRQPGHQHQGADGRAVPAL